MSVDGVAFTLKLGRALHLHGTPAHRLEEAMSELVELFGIEGHFFATPTAIFASLGSGDERYVELLRIEGGEVDLGRMSDLDALTRRVIHRRIDPASASAEVDRILAQPARYGWLLTILSFALTSGAASRFFGAGWAEMGMAVVTGLTVGLLAWTATRVAAVGRLFETLCGLAVSFVAVTGAALAGPLSIPIVTVAGLIVLVPGFTLTVAVSELAQKSLVSGTARLNNAIVVFLMLGFGVAVGGKAASFLFGSVASAHPIAPPAWSEPLSVILASVTLSILFKAHFRDFGWILLACGLTYLGVRQGSHGLGPELGVFTGALVLGVVSNLYARLLDRPAAVTRVPAMMLLVPGGLGFLSISSLLEQEVLQGLETAFRVALMAVALVTGLLVSNAIVPTSKKL